MKLKLFSVLSIAVMFWMLVPTTLRADVHDNANIFSASAVDDANTAMKKMERVHNKQFIVETFGSIPDDQKEAAAQNPDTFFKDWMGARARELKVNGVYALICMDPHHLEVGAGKSTIASGDFTEADVRSVYALMKAALHDKNNDKALTDAVDKVERAYTANISSPTGRSAVQGNETEYSNGATRSGNNAPTSSVPGFSLGSLICLGVAAVIIFSLVKSVLRGSGGGSAYGSGNYPPGGQGYGQNYGGGGFGYGGGGGSGFGRGFLGGLLGGALGGYAADRFDHRNDPTGGGGFSQGGDVGGNAGGSFDSGPSDAGQGFGDSGVGGDFGSSGGGGDSGGGGGSSGGDF